MVFKSDLGALGAELGLATYMQVRCLIRVACAVSTTLLPLCDRHEAQECQFGNMKSRSVSLETLIVGGGHLRKGQS